MAYIKTNWVARTGTNLNKFTKTSETTGSVITVAPRTGAWIETWTTSTKLEESTCRTPHGCVD